MKVDELLNDPANVRKHDKRNIDAIKASLQRFGQQKPIVIDSKGIVIAGNGTLSAAKELGWKDISVVETKLEGVDATAYAVADNRTAELAVWDEDALAQTLASLQVDDSIDEIVTGFSEQEIKDMIDSSVGMDDIEEDEVPEVPEEAITQKGDLWLLGEHRLLCGDSTSEDDVARLMDGETEYMVYTDPPYGMNLDTDFDKMFRDEGHVKKGNRFKKIKADSDYFDPTFILKMHSKTKEIFLWGADYFYDSLPRGGSFSAWDKRTENLDKVVGNTTEFLWSKKPHRRMTARVLWSGHHGMGKDDDKKRIHPTQKPIRLHIWFFENYGSTNNLILDLFLGSGSTLIACEQLGRKCFGMEIDPLYCDVIVKRWENLTGKKAVRSE